MPKRVLIFSLSYLPHVGGAEVAMQKITDRLSPSDIAFSMITMRFSASEPEEEQLGNIHIYRIGLGGSYLSKILYIPRAALRARRLYKEGGFDMAWAMMTYMVLPIVLLRMLGVRVPYALTLQDGDTFRHVFRRWYIRPLMPLLKLGFRRAMVVQTISTFLGKWVRQLGFTGPLEIIPNGVDVAAFTREVSDAELQSLKEKLGKKPGDVFLISTSRLVYKNALDDVIRALPKLEERVRFIILGTGPCEAAWRKIAHEFGVESRVQFLGHVDHANLLPYLRACDIFIRPSRSEGMGISFIEAFAAGLPVVATQEGGISDFLFDAKRNRDEEPTGFAVPKNSPECIAEVVQHILTNPSATARVIINAKALALEKYDWDVIAKDMQEKVFQ